jgi:hypothetical protein
MNPLLLFARRLINAFQCFGKRRYGYLDRSFCHITEGKEPLFLILSPDFYEIKIASIPVGTSDEALRYAPSYFDSVDRQVHYGAYRLDEGKYLLSVCQLELIGNHLESLGIEPSSIRHFVFAQDAFRADLLPMSLENGSVLALSDWVVVKLPSHYLNESVKSDLEKSLQNLLPCLTSFTVDMHKGGVPTKTTLMFTSILSLVIVLNFFIQGLFSYREGDKITQQQEEMKMTNHLPATQMELDTLAKTWENKENEQIKLRKIIAAFGTLSLESNTTVPQQIPSVSTTSSSNTIVLVPGSDPSQRNLLLVPGGDSNSTIVASAGEYVTSLTYQNGLIAFEILTPSVDRAQNVRNMASKILKTNAITVKDNLVQGSIQ